MRNDMMKCGHAANAKNGEGKPVCGICIGMHPGAEEIGVAPDLAGRMAKCSYCTVEKPSNASLAFFELGRWSKGVKNQDADTFYCGCRGWD